ncbi:hypothetical protein LSAT2_000064 [Lamellibrachia satsuma]|nr:hypothetical protein LSAT2_000064 [Lamellibrachia satsuma]
MGRRWVFWSFVIMLLFVSGHKRSADGTSRTAYVRSIHVCRKVDVRAMSNRTLSTTASSLAYCARRCVADSTCSSFNWKKSNRLCEFVSNYGKPPVYRANTDYIHYGPDVCPRNPTTTTTNCRTDWVMFRGSCILIVRNNSANTWHQARELCKHKGADLIEVAPDDMDPLYRIFGSTAYHGWIGCYSFNGQWLWPSGAVFKPSYTPPAGTETRCLLNKHVGGSKVLLLEEHETSKGFVCQMSPS